MTETELKVCRKDADETGFWLELIVDTGLQPAAKLSPLLKEANELTAIFVSSLKTARDGGRNPKSRIQNPK